MLILQPTWSYDPLPAMEQDSLAYLLLDIKEEVGAERGVKASTVRLEHGVAPLNVSLVLDTSGSMAGAKLENLKKAVGWVIDHLSAKDNLAVTLFDDEVHPLVESGPVSDRKGLREKIEAISEAGGTAMSKGLNIGLQEAVKGRNPGSISRIVVLTDGQTWGDADRCRDIARMAGAAGIPVTALGVGAEEDWSIELLDALASESGGHSDYIARPEEISTAFEKTLRAMQATAFRDLRLTFTSSSGVSVRAAYRVAPVLSKMWPGQEPVAPTPAQNKPVSLLLGEMEGGGAQSILFEIVALPRKPGQYRLARVLLDYEVAGPSSGQPQARQEVALDLAVGFAAGAGTGPGEPRVMNSVEKATTFKLQTRALQASMAGDVAAATRNLRAVATRLLDMGQTELAEAAEKEAQALEKDGRMTPAGTKKLAYDTRRLAVSEAQNVPPGT
ncbi:MAG TPA: VWA domain-containing protein [Chloroflexia bacterium]|nr:VWA domain-containing protein [Chloroflexia bacterium]